jgi:threonine dehydrogenase-like Zn-dependent dehydrogenase
MSESMLACVRKGPGDLVLERIPRPVLEALTDVILKTRLCTICGTDLHFEELPLPNIAMGHEVVGEIVETGDAVEGFQTGDRVVMSCMLACGQCASCQQGDPSACLHPMGRVKHGIFIHGCQAEYVRVPFASFSLGKIPETLEDKSAILAGDVFSTAVGVLERGDLRVGDSVAVFALGTLGLCVVKAARVLGAGMVIGVDPNPFRRETALKMGANSVLDPQEGEVAPKIIEMSHGLGVNIAVEAVGKEATLQEAFKTARIGGAISSLGVYGLTTQELSIPLSHGSMIADSFYHRRFVTTLCPSGRYRMERLMDLMVHADLDFSPLWTHTLDLEDILTGYEMAKDPQGHAIKIAVRPAGAS